jgi:hypothetical protein
MGRTVSSTGRLMTYLARWRPAVAVRHSHLDSPPSRRNVSRRR